LDHVFAMDVPLEFTQDESGSASFGISVRTTPLSF
jgi:hypothetical protein